MVPEAWVEADRWWVENSWYRMDNRSWIPIQPLSSAMTTPMVRLPFTLPPPYQRLLNAAILGLDDLRMLTWSKLKSEEDAIQDHIDVYCDAKTLAVITKRFPQVLFRLRSCRMR